MKLQGEDSEFQNEIEALISRYWPRDVVTAADTSAWRRVLVDLGMTVPMWPESAGGLSWSPTQAYLWCRSCHRLGAPDIWDVGAHIVGPAMLDLVQQVESRQQREFLNARIEEIRNLEVVWTIADTDEEFQLQPHFSGLVTQVPRGMEADWVLLQHSSVCLAINLDGQSVRRVASTMDERDAVQIEFNGVSSSAGIVVDLTLPGVTEPHGTTSGLLQQMVEMTKALIKDQQHFDSDAADSRLSLLEIELEAFNVMELRYLDALERDVEVPFPPQVLQVRGEDLYTQLGDLLIDTFGYYALPAVDGHAHHNEPGFGPPAGREAGRETDKKTGTVRIQQVIAQVFARTGFLDPLTKDTISEWIDSE